MASSSWRRPGIADTRRDLAHRASRTPPTTRLLIGVGGSDTMGTPSPWDNQIASFSAVAANGGAQAGLRRPGAHMQGLRVPNSYLDLMFPGGILDDRYFRAAARASRLPSSPVRWHSSSRSTPP